MSSTPQTLFSGAIDVSLRTATNVLATYPASAGAFAKVSKGLKAAEQRRRASAIEGQEVPPLMIISTTDACNLACAGCYACAHQRQGEDEVEDARKHTLLDEASALGVSVVLLAGGEPLLSQGWLEALGNHPDMVGIVFTNGTLLDTRRRAWFAQHRHIITALSIEGDRDQTDARRGEGVYDQVIQAMDALRSDGIPFGVSVTATSQNIDHILRDAFTTQYLQRGCRLFVYVEYVPVAPGSEPLVLSRDEKQRLNDFSVASARKHPALFIPFPGDEALYGGCLAAGRGFVHVSASGAVEPCPFAPFSDTNIKSATLKEALASRLLSKVRAEHHLLQEGNGGCALWHNREFFSSL